MGWLDRIFGRDDNKSQSGQRQSSGRTTQTSSSSRSTGAPSSNVNRTGQQSQSSGRTSSAPMSSGAGQESVPPERMGLNGEYDQSGLAKRVAQAFDQDSMLRDIETVWVAQTGSTVVLKGQVSNQQLLERMVSVARGINGAKSVDTEQVKVG